MGNLLKVLTREIENYPHFFLDFESKSGSGVEQREKEMDGERCWEGGRVTCSAVSFLSAGLCSPDDDALKESAHALLLFTSFFFFFPLLLCLLLGHDFLLSQL